MSGNFWPSVRRGMLFFYKPSMADPGGKLKNQGLTKLVSVLCVRKGLAVGARGVLFFLQTLHADPGANADRRPSVRGRNPDEPRSNGSGGFTRNVVERPPNAC